MKSYILLGFIVVIISIAGFLTVANPNFNIGCEFEESSSSEPYYKSQTLSGETTLWIDDTYQDGKGCMYENYGGQINEFIPNNKYSNTDNPTAKQVTLTPISIVLIKDKLCGIGEDCRGIYVKYTDKQGTIYLSQVTLSDWVFSELSSEITGQSSTDFKSSLLHMIDMFQNLDQKLTEKARVGEITRTFYQCTNRPDFESFKDKIVNYCSEYTSKAGKDTDLKVKIWRELPAECDCRHIVSFMNDQATGWQISYDNAQLGIY